MYVPAAFQVDDRRTLHDFIESHSFATLVTSHDGCPYATHLPLLLDRDREAAGVLIGHVARPNPHWEYLGEAGESLAIFHGPHAYISPSWYSGQSPAVPTWNYAAVHAYGRARLISDESELQKLLDRMVATYEADFEVPWQDNLDGNLRSKLLASIVGFEIPISRIEGKFKLGQNRSQADQQGTLTGLERNGQNELADFVRGGGAS